MNKKSMFMNFHNIWYLQVWYKNNFWWSLEQNQLHPWGPESGLALMHHHHGRWEVRQNCSTLTLFSLTYILKLYIFILRVDFLSFCMVL